MPAAWPSSLPQRLNRDSQLGMGEGRVTFSTDTGPGKMRRRSTAVAGRISGSMNMTAAQIETMRTFIRDDLGGGSLPFTFPPPRGIGDDLLVRFAIDGLPSWRHIGGAVWTVTFEWDSLP